MSTPYARAPHQGAGHLPGSGQHAALLIDFDNVTMGMRSDLSKDLKKLLQSDIIKGKVTVQRAYADWRRYPQYIVPLSEASIDLIFAPAYGSNKKNATDIRMAIDGMELVFTRPEIGTFILLTGDSDFSSLVLKLKEYGKYVIGVGIQESSSDILVQNCDEYYSYTSLTGLRKTTDGERTATDPWVLVEKAVNRMAERDDVMRSDRLKQVMIELDPNFDEGDFGYSKFSRFLSEAAAKKLLKLTKLENGQYEVGPAGGPRSESRRRSGDATPRPSRGEEREGGRGRGGRGRSGRGDRERPAALEAADQPEASAELGAPEAAPEGPPAEEAVGSAPTPQPDGGPAPLALAYELLRRSLRALHEMGREGVRDSDVKRKMLELDAAFDETELGFSKFSRFLRQAHDHEVIDLQKRDGGNYEVSLAEARERKGTGTEPAREALAEERPEVGGAPESPRDRGRGAEGDGTTQVAASATAGMGPRRGSTRRRRDEAEIPLFEGQVARAPELPRAGVTETVDVPAAAPSGRAARRSAAEPEALGLPSDRDAQIRYLSSFKGVGRKTAEAVVDAFGAELYDVIQNAPERLAEAVPQGRADQVLEGWRTDRAERGAAGASDVPESAAGEPEDAGTSDDGDAPEGERSGGRGSRGGRRTRRGGRRGGRDRNG